MSTTKRRPTMRQVSALLTKEDRYEPFKWYEKMRKESPIRWDSEREAWDVFDYATSKMVLENKDLFSSDRSQKKADSEKTPLERSLIGIDPPKHTSMRALVNRAFTPKVMKHWKPRIARIATMLLDKIDPKSEVDIVEQLSYPLPVIVISEILGVPIEDQEKFKEWSDWVVAGPKDNKPETISALMEQQERVNKELFHYFKEMIALKRETPGEDIISVLLQAEEQGVTLTEDELIGFCILLLIAGNETTTNLISNAFYCFTEFPEAYERIKENPLATLPLTIEEVLRYRSPVQAMGRVVKEDMDLHGHSLKAGDFIVPWIGSANRDEQQFPNSQQFIIDRKPNLHLAFGKGIHFCLGAPLARLEAEVILEEWIKRFPSFKRAASFTLEPIESAFVYGLKEFKVTIL
ncbi:cytochrome P450 [Fictibacillus macauensis ZFHKF-1]|uniref:Cytochrome P450 n=1 Tax=Fictibacillus macauensis ZFHKF-1 TaxID=1196324 RepID=I8UJW5_9BACL|nr:cytochrome P450 [Fictibacillus macauensis]EIT87113.1 cytochrome P450 [Fictibacillus macauensis ZFHKF-1]